MLQESPRLSSRSARIGAESPAILLIIKHLLTAKPVHSAKRIGAKANSSIPASPGFRRPRTVAIRTKNGFQFYIWNCACSCRGVARYLSIFLGLLLGVLVFGSLGTFLLYVPILPFAAVVTVLIGLILMFILGVQTGGRRIRILRRKSAAESQVASLNSAA
jgi:uncharacterized membrane protein YedE/YeeE